MNAHPLRFIPLLTISVILIAGRPAFANSSTYNGNGNTGFGGAVGAGNLKVSDDGSGGFDFTFTLGDSALNMGGNDLVIYLDDGAGGGIGADTSGMTDAADGARSPVSEYTTTGDSGGAGRSTLNFGGLMNPQFALDLSISGAGNNGGNSDIFKLVNGGSLNFIDNAPASSGASSNGETYTVANGVMSVDIPAVDFNLSAFSGATLKFAALEVSETGYSSNEGTEGVSGNEGWGNTQTITSVDTFTVAVPEPSAVGLVLCGGVAALLMMRRSRPQRS